MTTKQMNGSLHKKENMIDNVRKKNKENYICEQDQENRTFTTAFKDYERRTRFVKKTKEKRHKKINGAVDILHADGMWTTTERVDSELGKIK